MKFLPVLLFALPLAAFAQPAPAPAAAATPQPTTPAPAAPQPLKTPAPAAQPAAPRPAASPTPSRTSDRVNIAFPRTSVFEVLSFYETLTGKRMIRDSNLAGPELSIMVTEPVTRAEAIKLIESSLLLNGYSIVPVDDQTIKILGPSRAPRTEGLPLYIDSQALPSGGDQVVSFYLPLSFISPEEAITVLDQVVQRNAFGSIAAVPNTNAIIVTDKTPVIRKAISVVSLIDVEPAKVVTAFVPLQRASAEKIVEILDEMFGKDDPAKSPAAANAQAAPQTPEGNPAAPAGAAGARYENRLITGKAKFLADKRTNRILVVTRQENYRYVRDVIAQLDAAGTFEQPYVRVLNYVPAADVLPVLTDMLADPESGDATTTSNNPNATTGSNTGNNNSSSTFGSGASTGSSGGASSLTDKGDQLNEDQQIGPQSATIGETKLIADSSSNSIIVFGPPESKVRTKQILDLLDARPKQIYLAVVIGQLRINNEMEYGVNYLIRYQGASGNGAAAAVLNPLLFPGLTGNLPVASSIANPAALTNGLQSLSGLTVFGTIADSVDVYARFLESTNKFRTLSRPVVYTTNNRKAVILSGENVPVPSSTLTTATGGGVNNNGTAVTANIQYTPVLLKLEVIPLVNADHEVNLQIVQTNDKVLGFDEIAGTQAPRIGTQQIKTNVRVPNGSTIVLGGLITEDKTKNQSGIPYISKIPVLGSLLGGRTDNKVDKSELIVMIQPVVVESNHEIMKASAYEGDKTALGKDAQQVAAPVAEQAHEPAPWKPKYKPTPRPKN